MIDHLGVGVADFDRSIGFYEKALAPLGMKRLFDVSPEHTGGAPTSGFGEDRPYFWISGANAAQGRLHVAFEAKDRGAVDAFYDAAIRAGGRDNGPPGERPHYDLYYYSAFVIDPDGHNVEAVSRGAPAASPAS